MRPLRLALTAFGPYVGEQVVDFTRLGQERVFLVTGPTGSGKTTLLDAICFALYGETSGGERDPRSMRCQLAEPDLATEVTLDFALGPATYRVTRSPEQERAKLRGEGTTRQRPRACLWRVEGERELVLAAQWGLVTEQVERIIGFRSDQFRQTVLLPQGQFRRLLLADSRQRQQVLETLFRTELYRRIEEALRGAASELKRHAGEVGQEQRLILEQTGASCLEELEGRREALAGRLALLDEELVKAQESAREAAERLATGRDRVRRLDELAAAKGALEALEQRAGRHAADLERLDLARRAAGLVEPERRLVELEALAEQSADQLDHARLELARSRCARGQSRRTLERELALEPRREELHNAAGRLQHALGLSKRLQDARARLTAARQRFREAQARLDRIEDELSVGRQRLELLEQGWREGQAALLAGRLEPGLPCPVCGATSHPAPADASGPVPDEAGLKRQRRSVRDLEGKREQVRERAAEGRLDEQRIATEVVTLSESLGPTPDGDAFEQELAALQRRLSSLTRRRARAREADRVAGEAHAARQEALRQAETQAELSARRHREAERQLAARLQTSGFRSVTDYREARLSADALQELEQEVNERERAVQAAQERLRLARQGCPEHNRPDLEALEREERERAGRAQALGEERGKTRAQLVQHEQLLGRLRRAGRTAARLDQRLRCVGRIAEVAGGANPLRISFQRFVLASLLDLVLEAASRRLRAMSRGRYDLLRAGRGADLRRASGLDLAVHDSYSGTERPVHTLSGGESFLAALSLALGLADVVKETAGGLRLETIFIDEGFGSLDPEAFELAYRTLADLEGGSRQVGIISHVPELREWIGQRLEVTAGRGGSCVRQVSREGS